MAKKQEASPKKTKAAPKPKAKTSKPGNGQLFGSETPEPAKKAASPRAASQPVLSSEAIGIAAGEVWRVLSEQGGRTFAAIKKAAVAPEDHVLLALGWLAREDKLSFETNGRTVTVSLRS